MGVLTVTSVLNQSSDWNQTILLLFYCMAELIPEAKPIIRYGGNNNALFSRFMQLSLRKTLDVVIK